LGFRPVLAEAPPTATSNDQAEQATGLAGAPASVVDAFNKLDCTDVAARQGGDQAKPDEVVAACDREGTAKYILGATAVEGTDLSGAQAQLPRNSLSGWQVDLTFDTSGTSQFADITQQVVNLPPPGNQVAIVLDGLVVSAPRILEPITGGQAQITGTFTQAEANDLARVLQYGALPLAFDKSQISSISPTLGTDQLKAGLLAGAIGLTLVALYTLAYDRRLGLIAVASLAVAAAAVYGTVSLLGAVMNYRLSLVGIAGIIVAVGITADSFVVFFERVRDEIRDGRPQRTAVEYGWARARRTVIVADTVSLLAAAVLYLLSADQVRGFAFTLGLTTMIDVAVVFLFTKPVVTLATRTWLLRGRHSGLDPGSLGALFTEPGTRRPGLGARLYRGDTSIDVVGHWRRWAAISGVALALVLVGLLGRGLDLGVEFNGGAIFETREGSATIAEIRDAVEAQGVTEAQVRELSNGNILVEVGQVDPATAREIQNAVASTVGASPDEVKTDVIGPSWGADVTHKAELSLAIFLGLIIVYLSIAFEPLMAASAVIALLHDVLITVGVYALVGFTVTPCHDHRCADHPRLLALRHRGRLRQGQGEHQGIAWRAGIRARCQLGTQPDPDPIDQHFDHRAAPGCRHPVRRCRLARHRDPARPCPGAVRRDRVRHLLVAVRSRAAACSAKGTAASAQDAAAGH
jgi:protein-export membrane protein SecD